MLVFTLMQSTSFGSFECGEQLGDAEWDALDWSIQVESERRPIAKAAPKLGRVIDRQVL